MLSKIVFVHLMFVGNSSWLGSTFLFTFVFSSSMLGLYFEYSCRYVYVRSVNNKLTFFNEGNT